MKRQSILYITLLSIILLFSVGCEQTEKQNSTKKAGDRKTQVSHEAFAGYFEYIVMNISAGIDPAKKVLPQTIKALEKMMEAV